MVDQVKNHEDVKHNINNEVEMETNENNQDRREMVDEDLVNKNEPVSRGDYLLGYISLEEQLNVESKQEVVYDDDEKSNNLSEVFDSLLSIRKAELELQTKEFCIFKEKQNISPITANVSMEVVHPEAVIIGAGPVGCWTVMQLRMKGFNGKITMYEKSKDYTRNNIVKLPKVSEVNPRNIKIVELLSQKTASLKEIESTLFCAIKGLADVKVKFLNVDSLDNLSRLHCKNSLIFHCDGTTSKTRDLLFDNKLPVVTRLFNVVQFSYRIQLDEVEKLGMIKHHPIEKEYSDKVFFIEQSGSGKSCNN